MKASHSFSSLWSVAQASLTVRALLQNFAPEINEIILKTVPTPTQSLMQGVVRLRASSRESSWPTPSEARSLYVSQNGAFDITTPVDAGSSARLPYLAHKTHTLAHSCVEYYVQKCVDMRPSSLIKWAPGLNTAHTSNREVYDQSEGKPFQPPRTGPASWVEEQRVVLALWRIQFFLELKIALYRGRLGWVEDDARILSSAHLQDFFPSSRRGNLNGTGLEQTLTVYEYLQDLGGGDFVKKGYQLPDPPVTSGFIDKCPPRPSFLSTSTSDDPYNQGEKWLCRIPRSIIFQWTMRNHVKTTPLFNLPFQPYRKFGFALWDNKRMIDLGFAFPGGREFLHDRECYYVWYSILTEEEKQRWA